MSHRIHWLKKCPSCGIENATYRRGGSRRFKHREHVIGVNHDNVRRMKMWHCINPECIGEYNSRDFLYVR